MHAVVLIDAGYLYAAIALLFTGRPARSGVQVEPSSVVRSLRGIIAFGEDAEIYFFRRGSRPGRYCHASAMVGRWGSAPNRDAGRRATIDVDARISRTCVGLVRCQRVKRIALITGDSDFLPAIHECIGAGAHVEVLSIEGINQSQKLARTASSAQAICRDAVESFAGPETD